MRMHARIYTQCSCNCYFPPLHVDHVGRGTDVQLEKSQRKVTRLVDVLDAIKVS